MLHNKLEAAMLLICQIFTQYIEVIFLEFQRLVRHKSCNDTLADLRARDPPKGPNSFVFGSFGIAKMSLYNHDS